jgi:hypothetical protein
MPRRNLLASDKTPMTRQIFVRIERRLKSK